MRRRQRHTRSGRIGLAAAAALSRAPVGVPGALANHPVEEPTPPVQRDDPYPKTWLLLPWGELADQSQENIERIAASYDWINTHGGSWFGETAYPMGGEVGDRLRELNPDLILSNYRNGSYTNQYAMDEAGAVEREIPLAIAVHDTKARLTAPLGAGETTVVLHRPPGVVDNRVPVDQRPVAPFKASTTSEEFSLDKIDYVGWLRLDDEILRIDAVRALPGELIELTVVRGYWGTQAGDHAADALPLQPIYNGRIMPNGREILLSGVPGGNSAGQLALRYVLMQQSVEYWEWLGDLVQETFDAGYDAPWFDTTSSDWINHANAFGVPAIPYDVDLQRALDRETFREYQQAKIDYLVERYPDKDFYVNWFFPRHYFDDGHERLMFSGENGYAPMSGGAIEQFANPDFMDWFQLMAMVIDMRDNDFRGVAWVKGQGMSLQYQYFAYATYLLTYEEDGELYYGHDPDPADPATPGMYPDVPRQDFLSSVPDAPAFLRWDFGTPEERFADIAQAERADAPGVYSREFSCGQVLVNPDFTASHTVELGQPYYHVATQTWVESVDVGPRTGHLLVAGQCEPETEPVVVHG